MRHDLTLEAAPVTAGVSLPVAMVRAPDTAGAVVAAHLRSLVDAYLELEPRVRLDADDAVHRTRIAVRRLRSALATYRRLLDRDRSEHLRAELQWLGGVLGPVRDAEVIAGHLTTMLDHGLDGGRADGDVLRHRMETTLARLRTDARQAARAALSSDRYGALLDDLRSIDGLVLVQGRTEKRAKKELRKHMRRAHRRLRRAVRDARAAERPTDEQLHAVRKRAKRVRYAAESVSEVVGRKADRLATSLERVQDTLGAHQDTVVIRAVLRELAADAAAAGEDTFGYGRLDALEEARGRAARAEWQRAVDDGVFGRPGWLR